MLKRERERERERERLELKQTEQSAPRWKRDRENLRKNTPNDTATQMYREEEEEEEEEEEKKEEKEEEGGGKDEVKDRKIFNENISQNTSKKKKINK